MAVLKKLIQSLARKAGYQVQKYPSLPFLPVSVFDLSVKLLMAIKGRQIKFIQVGANDGQYGDPLRKYIMKYPWHGILIEPQPEMFAKLCENYAAAQDRLTFENVAIAGGRTSIAMYKAPSTGSGRSGNAAYAASVVSINPRVVANQLGIAPRDLEHFEVRCMTLDELIMKHEMSEIDILQIDAEGYDYEVLKTLNLSTVTPLIIQFEHGHLSPREIDGAVEYLNSYGYRVMYGGNQMDTVALSPGFVSSME